MITKTQTAVPLTFSRANLTIGEVKDKSTPEESIIYVSSHMGSIIGGEIEPIIDFNMCVCNPLGKAGKALNLYCPFYLSLSEAMNIVGYMHKNSSIEIGEDALPTERLNDSLIVSRKETFHQIKKDNESDKELFNSIVVRHIEIDVFQFNIYAKCSRRYGSQTQPYKASTSFCAWEFIALVDAITKLNPQREIEREAAKKIKLAPVAGEMVAIRGNIFIGENKLGEISGEGANSFIETKQAQINAQEISKRWNAHDPLIALMKEELQYLIDRGKTAVELKCNNIFDEVAPRIDKIRKLLKQSQS